MQDLILNAVQTLGPVGVGFLMLLENLFPPLPSELIMPLAGYLAARGDVSLPGAMVGGTVGSVLGAIAWYTVGRRVPRGALLSWVDAHGRWLTICSPDVELAERFFKRARSSSSPRSEQRSGPPGLAWQGWRSAAGSSRWTAPWDG